VIASSAARCGICILVRCICSTVVTVPPSIHVVTIGSIGDHGEEGQVEETAPGQDSNILRRIQFSISYSCRFRLSRGGPFPLLFIFECKKPFSLPNAQDDDISQASDSLRHSGVGKSLLNVESDFPPHTYYIHTRHKNGKALRTVATITRYRR
jgi:hypothetical protein